MATTVNKQIVLANRPQGWVQESDFRIQEQKVPELKDGEVLVQHHYLSLDPYMRGRMSEGESYAENVALGQVMVGGTVGVVQDSRNPAFQSGDTVLGYGGWQQYSLSNGKDLQKLPFPDLPMSAYLGAVGMPGITAWVGLLELGQPKPGETVVVSAASGAVGSVVGQLAKRHNCRAVGIAGGKEKCDYVVKELSFDACVDYKGGNLLRDLEAATPQRIDIYFENVGGEVLEAVTTRLNDFARIPLCGLVSQYNVENPHGLHNLSALLVHRVKLQGFIVGDHIPSWPKAIQELAEMYRNGQLKYRETVEQGLENAPRAFIGMLKGQNFGKQLVKLV